MADFSAYKHLSQRSLILELSKAHNREAALEKKVEKLQNQLARRRKG